MATFGKVNDPEKSRSLGRLSLGRKCCKFQLWSTPKPRSTNTFSQPQFWAPLSMLARNLFAVFNSRALQAPVTIYDSATLPICANFWSCKVLRCYKSCFFSSIGKHNTCLIPDPVSAAADTGNAWPRRQKYSELVRIPEISAQRERWTRDAARGQ